MRCRLSLVADENSEKNFNLYIWITKFPCRSGSLIFGLLQNGQTHRFPPTTVNIWYQIRTSSCSYLIQCIPDCESCHSSDNIRYLLASAPASNTRVINKIEIEI